jgi:hypothetical protein
VNGKSTHNGKTWQQLSGGLPAGIRQANLPIAPSNTNNSWLVAISAGICTFRRRRKHLGDHH